MKFKDLNQEIEITLSYPEAEAVYSFLLIIGAQQQNGLDSSLTKIVGELESILDHYCNE